MIEMLNGKYNLDYYSSSESDTNSEPDYRYEQDMKLSYEHFYRLNYCKNYKAEVKFAMNSLNFLMCNFSSNAMTEYLVLIIHTFC